MPSKKCRNPSCTEVNPEFYSYRHLCKKCYLDHNREKRKKLKEEKEEIYESHIEDEIKELRSIINILTKRLDDITINCT
jgi:hypothetical protein